MSHRPRPLAVVLLLSGMWASACGTRATTARPALAPAAAPTIASPVPAPPSPAPQQPDPVQVLIDVSRAHFDKGHAELQLGHLERAKSEFNLALDVLLESPYGARTNARIQEHFDRLVDRISGFEVRALIQGDGFTEQPEQPASLDELLALTTFDLPAPKPELKVTVELDLKSTAHDIPIPLNARILSYIELFQGRLRDWFQASLQRGQAYMPMIQEALRAEGLPLDLAFIPIVESAFHTNALSRAKAKGSGSSCAGRPSNRGSSTTGTSTSVRTPTRLPPPPCVTSECSTACSKATGT